MKMVFKTKIFFIFLLVFSILPFFVLAVHNIDETVNFYVDSDYDLEGREEVSAILREVSNNAYFYVENTWWGDLDVNERNEIKHSLSLLADEFDETIYPELTSVYGQEWKPGIDNDEKITVLFHQTNEGAAGYFRTADEYRKIQAPISNEKEMVYLSLSYINKEIISSYLAHEFTHLITFNQKDRLNKTEEDVWLNELRAEYAPTLVGYDDILQASNLNQRINTFISNPSDSLTEWKSEERDYGIINLFAQYLVEEYGIDILVDSLESPYSGIASLNYALKINDFEKDIEQIFSDWAVAVYINDCELGQEYCYKKEALKHLSIAPNLLYLPNTQEANMSLVYAIKQWSGHWYKIIGGGKGLKVDIKSLSGEEMNIAYLIKRQSEIEKVEYLELDEGGQGIIELPYFSEDNQSLIIIPTITTKTSNFTDSEPFWRFSLDIETIENEGNSNNDLETPIEQMTPEQLKEKIAEVIALIAQLKELIADEETQEFICSSLDSNLYYGLNNNNDVKCLQQFLKNQGEEIYPQGLVTGNFLDLTKEAVVRFQEKYAQEILEPLGLENGTGYVGQLTREKINQIIGR